MHRGFGFAAIAVAAGLLLSSAPAEAKTCKDVITMKSRSSAQTSDSGREQRARDRAILKWSQVARETHGWAYRFWLRADDKQVECSGTAKSKLCTVSAKPCRVL
jgi:hypothetical protein